MFGGRSVEGGQFCIKPNPDFSMGQPEVAARAPLGSADLSGMWCM
jgi:hypothetical protein